MRRQALHATHAHHSKAWHPNTDWRLPSGYCSLLFPVYGCQAQTASISSHDATHSVPQASQPDASGIKAWRSSLRSTGPGGKTLCCMHSVLSSLDDMASIAALVKDLPAVAVAAFGGTGMFKPMIF